MCIREVMKQVWSGIFSGVSISITLTLLSLLLFFMFFDLEPAKVVPYQQPDFIINGEPVKYLTRRGNEFTGVRYKVQGGWIVNLNDDTFVPDPEHKWTRSIK